MAVEGFDEHYPFETALGDGQVQCEVCPHRCRLKEGQRGRCFGRRATGGHVELSTYGRLSSVSDDPIEKKPLYHFLPGTRTLSVGAIGCNLACRFCQNWTISQPDDTRALRATLAPEQVAELAVRAKCPSVSFTYNEPIVSVEFVRDTARACRARGLRTVAVTAGYAQPAAREAFFEYIDAVNVDLKAMQDGFYRRLCGARLAPVLDTLCWLHEQPELWLEVTHLIIPDENDSDEDLDATADWCRTHLGEHTPLHFSAFFPTHRLTDHPPTDVRRLWLARERARSHGLRHVYIGNTRVEDGARTWCGSCGAEVIRRDGFSVTENRLSRDGKCPACGAKCPGVYS